VLKIELQKLLTPEEAGQIIGIRPETLRQWRTRRKKGLRFMREGRVIRYRPEDVREFIDSRVVDPCAKTSRAAPRKTA
jgi:hypothetical protein